MEIKKLLEEAIWKATLKHETGKESLMSAIRRVYINPPPITDEGIKEFMNEQIIKANFKVKCIGGAVSYKDGNIDKPVEVINFRFMGDNIPKVLGTRSAEITSQKTNIKYFGYINTQSPKCFYFYSNNNDINTIENQEDFLLNII